MINKNGEKMLPQGCRFGKPVRWSVCPPWRLTTNLAGPLHDYEIPKRRGDGQRRRLRGLAGPQTTGEYGYAAESSAYASESSACVSESSAAADVSVTILVCLAFFLLVHYLFLFPFPSVAVTCESVLWNRNGIQAR